jgi:hypothetical protein
MSARSWIGDPKPERLLCLWCGDAFFGNWWRAFCLPCNDAAEYANAEHIGGAASSGVSESAGKVLGAAAKEASEASEQDDPNPSAGEARKP